jgi:hypothetical protein
MARSADAARRRGRAAAAALAVVLAGLTAAPAGAQVWTLDEHPPPPAGAPFKVPLGTPGDLQMWAPNRGLLAVEGNSTVPRGLWVWDGERWRQLATVCGGAADTTRIAWAGPTEFWTITEPSLPRRGNGTALCRFRDGEVVGSFSAPEQAADAYRRMNAAACLDGRCWFAGGRTTDPSGTREGAFHLHFDGGGLGVLYDRGGRGVSDLHGFDGRFHSASVAGAQVDSREPGTARPVTGEDRPRLLGRIDGLSLRRDAFTPRPVADPDPDDGRTPPADATDVLALDSTGPRLWAVGGGTTSGAEPYDPQGPTGAAMYDRPPFAAVLEAGTWRELRLDAEFAPGERFVDVAAIPGTAQAWIAVQRFADRRSPGARGRVLRVDASGVVVEDVTLPTSGSGRGAVARVDCAGPADCWAVTTAGWLLHWTDGTRSPLDADPAFARLIDFRPNESAAQFIPDAPPPDDSRLFAPPPVEVQQAAPPAQAPAVQQLPALLTSVRSRMRGRRQLVITFRLARRARIGVVGRRRGKVVARFRTRTFLPGRRTIRVRLDPRRYPTRLAFAIRELDVQTAPGDDLGAGAGDTVTTGPPPAGAR